MPARVIRSIRARQDLIDIWHGIAPDNIGAADAVLERIDAACQLLSDFPRAGAPRDDLRRGLRQVVVQPYLVMYRVADDDVVIVRVIDGRRDLTKLF